MDLRKTIENLDHESNVMNSRIAEMDADQSMLKRMVAKNETAVFSLTYVKCPAHFVISLFPSIGSFFSLTQLTHFMSQVFNVFP